MRDHRDPHRDPADRHRAGRQGRRARPVRALRLPRVLVPRDAGGRSAPRCPLAVPGRRRLGAEGRRVMETLCEQVRLASPMEAPVAELVDTRPEPFAADPASCDPPAAPSSWHDLRAFGRVHVGGEQPPRSIGPFGEARQTGFHDPDTEVTRRFVAPEMGVRHDDRGRGEAPGSAQHNCDDERHFQKGMSRAHRRRNVAGARSTRHVAHSRCPVGPRPPQDAA